MSGTYYPSCVVNFRLRFDEVFRIAELPEPGPAGGDINTISNPVIGGKKIRGIQHDRINTVPATRPLITQTGIDNLSFVLNRVPKSAQVELPSYRQAGKFTLEFDWRELPIDPRLCRSCGVEIFFGSVSPEDFSTGMTRVEPDGRRRSVMNTKGRDDLMVLAGVVDNWATTHNESGGVTKMEGRDLRGVFLDSPINPDVFAKLDLNQPLNLVVKQIVEKHPAGPYIRVLSNDSDWPGGVIPSVLDKDALTRVRRKASGEGSEAGQGGDDKTSYWDIITQYCFLVGAVPYFRGRDIVIRPARSIFDQSKPRSFSSDRVFDNPGAARHEFSRASETSDSRLDDDGNPFTERKMVLGRNIKELTFERKLSGVKVPMVEVVSFDTSSTERGAKKLLTAQWPPEDKKAALISGVSPSGETSQTDKTRISVPGIRDHRRLLMIAKALYEEIGRQEMGGSCKTTQLASFKGGNDDPDLLRLRPGDSVEFMVDTRQIHSRAPNVSTYIDSQRQSFNEAVKEFRKALSGKSDGGDENLARVLAASSRSTIIDLMRTFKTSNVVYGWSSTGIQISFDFQNYVIIRSGITPQLGANTAAPRVDVANPSTAKRPKVKIDLEVSVQPVSAVKAAAKAAAKKEDDEHSKRLDDLDDDAFGPNKSGGH